MTDTQKQIKNIILSKMSSAQQNELVYSTEWLGYLPYGQYHRVDLNGEDISREFPQEWSFDDLDFLSSHGLLKVIKDSRETDDDEEFKIIYHVMRTE